MSDSAAAEKLLNKLRKQSANRVCANCLTQSRLGFQAVCVKYKTFICHMCKSSHQAYSHRVKSVTMSTWTMAEVEELRKKNGGGNENARAKWFANMTPKDEKKYMPGDDAPLDKYKELIFAVYEEKRFYSATAIAKPVSDAGITDTTRKPRRKKKTDSVSTTPQGDSFFQNLNVSKTQALNKPEDDLLSFDFTSSDTSSAPQNPGYSGGQDNVLFMDSSDSLGPRPTSSSISTNDLFASLSVKPSSSGPGSFMNMAGSNQQQSMPVMAADTQQQHSVMTARSTANMNVNNLNMQMGNMSMNTLPIHSQVTGNNASSRSMPVGVMSSHSGSYDDPFASLQQKKSSKKNKKVIQKQFINQMAQATGDPFAGLHMKPIGIQRQTVPQTVQMPQMQQMAMQPPTQSTPMTMHMNTNMHMNMGMGMGMGTSKSASNDPFAGLQ